MINSIAVRLPAQEWKHIFRLGVDEHIKELESELARATEKIKTFEAKYKMSFARLEQVGLPNNAGLEAHEDYVEWSSWEGYHVEIESKLDNLRSLVGNANVR